MEKRKEEEQVYIMYSSNRNADLVVSVESLGLELVRDQVN